MKTIRIFISSPGDVAEERERAKQVIDSLKRRYAASFLLKPVLWEDLPLQAGGSFQEGIDMVLSHERGIDIAVFILWSRMGSPLGAMIRKPDGSNYLSGTEREFDLMLRAREKSGGSRPAFLVYTRRDETSFEERLRSSRRVERSNMLQQKKLVERFIAEEFHDRGEGHNMRAYHSFDRPQNFSKRLRSHLVELLDEMAGGDFQDVVWDIDLLGPPFMGLESFGQAQATVFCGREDEVLEARHAIATHAGEGCAFLLITGASGSGKSSLVKAGLLPAICAQEQDEAVAEWRPLIVTPSELGADAEMNLMARLATPDLVPALRAEGVAFDKVVTAFRDDASSGMELLKQAIAVEAKKKGGGVRVLLVVDQLEEVFAHPDGQSILMLLDALARSGVVWVVATVRGDFMGEVFRHPVLAHLLEGRQVFSVLTPDADALRRMIEEPARLAGLRFEQRGERYLSDKILADAARHADLLPLVEFVLLRLYEQRSSDGLLSWEVYEKQLGGVEGALRRRADEVFDALPSDVRDSLPQLLKRLVTLAETGSGSENEAERFIRQRVSLSDFPPESPMSRLIDSLIAERLLITSFNEEGDSGSVTVAHEALLRVWPRAMAWAEGNRDLLRTRARIAARMLESERIAEGDPLLEVARLHLIGDPEAFSEAQRGFIERSIRSAEEQRLRIQKIRRIIMAVMTCLTIIAIIAATWAWRREKDAGLAREAAEQSQVVAETANQKNVIILAAASNGDLGAANKALEEDFFSRKKGVRASGSSGLSRWHEGVALLARSIQRNPNNSAALERLYHTLTMYGQAYMNLALTKRTDAVAHDGRFATPQKAEILASDEDGKLVLSEMGHEPNKETFVPGVERAVFAAFIPGSERFIVVEQNRKLSIWSTTTMQTIGEPIALRPQSSIFRLSPDGSLFATIDLGPEIQIIDLNDAQKELKTYDCEGYPMALEFAPDGQCVVVGNRDGSAHLIDVETMQLRGETIREEGKITAIRFSPDSKQMAILSQENHIIIRNTSDGQATEATLRHAKRVSDLDFSPDGSIVATTCDDNQIYIWNQGETEVPMMSFFHDSIPTRVRFSPCLSVLLSTCRSGFIYVWDLSKSRLAREPMRHGSPVASTHFNVTGSLVLSQSLSGDSSVQTVRVAQDTIIPLGLVNRSQLAILNQDSSLLADVEESSARLWSIPEGKALSPEIIATKTIEPSEGHDALTSLVDIMALKFDTNANKLLGVTQNLKVTSWDLPAGKQSMDMHALPGNSQSVKFNPKLAQLAVLSEENELSLIPHNADGKPGLPVYRRSNVAEYVFSANGKFLLIYEYATALEIVDTKSLQSIQRIPMEGMHAKSFTIDSSGRRVIVNLGDTLAIRDIRNLGDAPIRVGQENKIRSIALSPDDRTIACGSANGVLFFLDATTGATIGERSNFVHAIDNLSFSHDGRFLVVGTYFNANILHVPFQDMDDIHVEEVEPLIEWAFAVSGIRFNQMGEMEEIPHDERVTAIHEMARGDTRWSALSLWISDETLERPFSMLDPYRVSVSKFAANLRDLDDGRNINALDAARRVDPRTPLVGLLLASHNDKDDQISTFLRRFDLEVLSTCESLMPNEELSLLYSRAARELNEMEPDAFVGIGPNSSRVAEEAVRVADKALELDPDNVQAIEEKKRSGDPKRVRKERAKPVY
jgi:WD40 repeat protein